MGTTILGMGRDAPESFEVLQQTDGATDFLIRGELVCEENATADSRPFSADKLIGENCPSLVDSRWSEFFCYSSH